MARQMTTLASIPNSLQHLANLSDWTREFFCNNRIAINIVRNKYI